MRGSLLLVLLLAASWGVCLESPGKGEESSFYLVPPEAPLEAAAILANLSTSSLAVSPGARALLHCTVAGAAGRTVSWVRVDAAEPSLLAVGQFVFSGDARLAVVRAANISRWSLVITDVARGDSGAYQCQVNTVPHLTHEARLRVVEPRCRVEGEGVVYLRRGSPHTITCTITSPAPPHHVFWYFQHQPLAPDSGWLVHHSLHQNSSTSTISIQRAGARHSGRYECRPSNSPPSPVTLVVLEGELHAAMQSRASSLAPSTLPAPPPLPPSFLSLLHLPSLLSLPHVPTFLSLPLVLAALLLATPLANPVG